MRRVLSLSLPGFSVHRWLRDRRRALARALGEEAVGAGGVPEHVVVVATSNGAHWVAERSPAVRAIGVERGMSLAHARALLGKRELVLAPFDAEEDRRALAELGEWAMRFSPLVALDPPAGLFFDVAGTERLFGEIPDQLARIAGAFEDAGFPARAAVAETVGCAWAVARFGRERCAWVRPGEERAALAPLPVAALRLGFETLEALAEVGVERVAHLFELARDELPARFGEDLLLRLDQALGRAFEPVELLRPTEPLERARSFEQPVELEVLLTVFRALLQEVVVELGRRGEGARKLAVRLACAEAPAVEEELVLSRPSADCAHLLGLLEPRLERANLGNGAERVLVGCAESVPFGARQVEAWESGAGPARVVDRELGEFLDVLVARLGRERVLEIGAVESHLPEHAFALRSHLDGNGGKGLAHRIDKGADEVAESPFARLGVTPLERPTRLLARPEAVRVEEREGLPARVTWRGEAAEVVDRRGPERLEPPWWPGARGGRPAGTGTRDYFRVLDASGRWLWLVRASGARWFVHGEWC